MSVQVRHAYSLPDAATKLLESGLSVIPITSAQAKNPAILSWKVYNSRPATPAEARGWWQADGSMPPLALGVVCGKVSGNLTVIDFDVTEDGVCLYDAWFDLVSKLDDSALFDLPIVQTPSGGVHVYLRCDVCESGTRLAESPRREVLIETRGEGHYVLAPPTPGYVKRVNTIRTIPVVTPATRQLLLDCARMLDARPPVHPRGLERHEILPGDAYNTKATMESVLDLLKTHGWSQAGTSGETVLLRRPGKERGTSATLTEISGMPVFYCFSTNAPQVPAGQGLSPFSLYAHLAHNGDFSAAAAALAKGYKLPPVLPLSGLKVVQPSTRTSWRDLTFSGADLFHQTFEPVEFVVSGVVPPGLTLFAAPPKCGKSWLAWNIALAVATGGTALGSVPTRRRHVLYLMLEEGKRLVNARMHKLVADDADLSWLTCAQGWRKLTDDGAEMIEDFCTEHPDALVVVDTYESLRGSIENGRDSYQNDYGALKPLHDKCKDHKWSVLVIHHTNKRGGDDPFSTVNGSNGISGCVDTVGVMQRRNDSDEVVLHLRGRELDADQHLMLEFNALEGGHRLLGDAVDVGVNRQQQDIVAFLQGADGPATPKEIALACGRENDKALLMQLGRMVASGVLLKNDWGRYTARADGNKGNTSLQGSCIDAGAVEQGVQGCVTFVTPVTPVTTPEENAPAPPDEAGGEQQTLMRNERCAVCGKNTPYWAPLKDGEKAYCPTHAPKRRRK
jgi:hypothetical protein